MKKGAGEMNGTAWVRLPVLLDHTQSKYTSMAPAHLQHGAEEGTVRPHMTSESRHRAHLPPESSRALT